MKVWPDEAVDEPVRSAVRCGKPVFGTADGLIDVRQEIRLHGGLLRCSLEMWVRAEAIRRCKNEFLSARNSACFKKISEDRRDKEHFRRGHENWRAGEDSETFRELRSAYDQVSFLLLAW